MRGWARSFSQQDCWCFIPNILSPRDDCSLAGGIHGRVGNAEAEAETAEGFLSFHCVRIV